MSLGGLVPALTAARSSTVRADAFTPFEEIAVSGKVLVQFRDPNALICGVSQTRLPFTRVALVAGIVTVSALSCSCTSSDPPPSTTTTSASVGSSTATTPSTGTSAPTTGTSVQAVDVQLHDAIDAFWKLFVEVGGRTGPWDEATTRSILQQRATGTELEQLITIFQGNAVAGYVVQGSMQISPTVVSVDGDTATVPRLRRRHHRRLPERWFRAWTPTTPFATSTS